MKTSGWLQRQRLCLPRLLLPFLLCAACPAHAQSTQPQPAFEQRLNAGIPLQTVMMDDDGRSLPMRTLFDRKPVVLVFGYYRCPNLCSTVMEGVLQTLAAIESRQPYRLVAISIDPTENSADAAAKKARYRSLLPDAELHFLTGDRMQIDSLADAAGFHYAYDPASKQYIHPSGFLIATPDGVISRYFLDVRFRSADVGQALREAAAGRVGSLADRLLLLCAHFDPTQAKYSGDVMIAIRTACMILLLALAAWIALQLRRAGRRQ